MEPMPPNTAAVNALMPGIEPVVGIREVLKEHSSTPAMAAERGADGKRHGNGSVDVDTHELRRALILGAGTHGFTHFALADEVAVGQGQHDDDAGSNGQKGKYRGW